METRFLSRWAHHKLKFRPYPFKSFVCRIQIPEIPTWVATRKGLENNLLKKNTKKLTRMIGLAVDEPVKTPASKAHHDEIHDQVEKQQWSCYISAHSRSHLSSTSSSSLFKPTKLKNRSSAKSYKITTNNFATVETTSTLLLIFNQLLLSACAFGKAKGYRFVKLYRSAECIDIGYV